MGIPGTAGIGLPSLQQVGDFSAGFGDAVTLGGTNWVREQLGVNDAVNKCSAAFGWGGYAGQAASLVPIAGGARLAAAGTVRAAPILKESGSRTFARLRALDDSGAVNLGAATGRTLKSTLKGTTEAGNRRAKYSGKAYDSEAEAKDAAQSYANKNKGCEFRGLCSAGDHYHVDKSFNGRLAHTRHYYF